MYEDALERMNERATPDIMRLRRSIVELPFGTIKYRIFGYPRLLLRGHAGARTELGLAVMTYNLKRMANVLGTVRMTEALPSELTENPPSDRRRCAPTEGQKLEESSSVTTSERHLPRQWDKDRCPCSIS
jgi:hypothetical protein